MFAAPVRMTFPAPVFFRAPPPTAPASVSEEASGFANVPPDAPSVTVRFVLPLAPVNSRVPLSSAIVVPAPSGLFAPAFATEATLTLPPPETLTGPVKLFVFVIVSLAAPVLVSPVVPAMACVPVIV